MDYPKEDSNQFICRDTRRKQMFQVDDEYLNGYARLLGVTASMVYVSLCRHANRSQKAWPSQKLIAEELAVDERTVRRGIEKLVEWNIVTIQRLKDETNKWKPNVYSLVDKSLWKPKPEDTSVLRSQRTLMQEPEDINAESQRTPVSAKGNTYEGNTKKEGNRINFFDESDVSGVVDNSMQENINHSLDRVRDQLKRKGIVKD